MTISKENRVSIVHSPSRIVQLDLLRRSFRKERWTTELLFLEERARANNTKQKQINTFVPKRRFIQLLIGLPTTLFTEHWSDKNNFAKSFQGKTISRSHSTNKENAPHLTTSVNITFCRRNLFHCCGSEHCSTPLPFVKSHRTFIRVKISFQTLSRTCRMDLSASTRQISPFQECSIAKMQNTILAEVHHKASWARWSNEFSNRTNYLIRKQKWQWTSPMFTLIDSNHQSNNHHIVVLLCHWTREEKQQKFQRIPL